MTTTMKNDNVKMTMKTTMITRIGKGKRGNII